MPVSFARRDPTLIFGPDDFSDGKMCGWEPLLNSTTPVGPVLPTQWPAHENRGALQLSIEDGGVSVNPWNYCMALKRMTLPNVSKIRWSLWLGIAAYHAASGNWIGPRTIDLGLDTGWGAQADGSDNRTFYKFRWQIYDEVADAPSQKLQIAVGTIGAPTFTDIPSGVYKYGFNEGKRGMIPVTMEFDIANRKYSGIALGNVAFGSLASPADTSLTTLGTPTTAALNQGGAASFYGGMNFCVEVNGRNSSALSKSKVSISSPTAWGY